MALGPNDFQKLGKATSKLRKPFAQTFRDFLFAELAKIDVLLQGDVAALGAIFPQPLADAQRVIVRQRLLYRVAETNWINGGQRVGNGWDDKQFSKAMRSVSPPEQAQCELTTAQLTTLEGLLEHYAEGLVNDILAPTYEAWIENQVAETMKELRIAREDFGAVRSNMNKQLQGEMFDFLYKRKPIQLKVAADQVRKKPYG